MKKLIALVIVAVMLLGMMPMMAMAADGTTVYMNPDGWRVDDAKFAIWCFESNNGGSDKFVSMTARSDGLFEAVVPAGYQKIIFVRMNGSTAGNSWDHKWDQTADLDLPTNGDNCYKISSAAWSKFVTDPITVHVNVSSAWGEVVPVVWAWGTAGDVFSNPGWPGKTMEVDAFNDGWYTMELPYTTTGLLLNDRGTTTLLKTENYTISAGEELWLTVGEYKNDNNNGAEKIYAAVSSAAAPTGWYTSAPIKVTLDPGEGAVEPTMLTADPDGNVTLPAASRPNYVFDGWYKEAELTNLVGQAGKTVTFTGNATIYAKWSEDMTGRHTITFINGTTEFTTKITKKADANMGKLETIPDGPTAPANHEFDGWVLENGTKVTTDTPFTGPTSVYAQWKKLPTLTLSFNLNGGEGNAPADVSSVDGVVALPAAPSRDGYTFNGWYDAATGGNLVIAADATTYAFTGGADASKTLYAQWTEITTIKVHAKVPTDWTAAYLYAWNSSGDKETWPGEAMTKGDDSWYTFDLPVEYTSVVISNNGGNANVQTKDLSINTSATEVWITLTEKGEDNKYKADIVYPDNTPELTISEYYLHGWINGGDVADTTHKFVNGTITVELTGDNYVYIGTDIGVNYKTNGWLGKEVKEATLATDYATGDKLFVPAGNVTFTLVVNDDGTVKLSYAVAAPEGGNQGGNQGGTEGGNQGGNQSGTAGNPEAPAGGTEGGSEVEEITINVKVPADWENPCLWAWQENGDNDINAFDAWPGMALTKGENGWYYAKVPANMNYMIVNAHNGAWQTPDTAIEKSKCDVWAEVVVDAAGQATIKMQYTSPATGDTAIIAPVVFLMVMSVTGLAVLTVGKKKYF